MKRPLASKRPVGSFAQQGKEDVETDKEHHELSEMFGPMNGDPLEPDEPYCIECGHIYSKDILDCECCGEGGGVIKRIFHYFFRDKT